MSDTPMTDKQALAILQNPKSEIWYESDEGGRPLWGSRTIYIDGRTTVDELRAFLHFAPRAAQGKGESS